MAAMLRRSREYRQNDRHATRKTTPEKLQKQEKVFAYHLNLNHKSKVEAQHLTPNFIAQFCFVVAVKARTLWSFVFP